MGSSHGGKPQVALDRFEAGLPSAVASSLDGKMLAAGGGYGTCLLKQEDHPEDPQ